MNSSAEMRHQDGYSAIMIADYIVSQGRGLLTPFQVLKLTYISHGYTLALLDMPLILNRIEAWKYGPVIPVLYRALKHHKNSKIPTLSYCGTNVFDDGISDRIKFMKDVIPEEPLLVVDKVIEKYGDFTMGELYTMTHQKNTPWDKCYKKGNYFVEMPNDVIKKHYKELLDVNAA